MYLHSGRGVVAGTGGGGHGNSAGFRVLFDGSAGARSAGRPRGQVRGEGALLQLDDLLPLALQTMRRLNRDDVQASKAIGEGCAFIRAIVAVVPDGSPRAQLFERIGTLLLQSGQTTASATVFVNALSQKLMTKQLKEAFLSGC